MVKNLKLKNSVIENISSGSKPEWFVLYADTKDYFSLVVKDQYFQAIMLPCFELAIIIITISLSLKSSHFGSYRFLSYY